MFDNQRSRLKSAIRYSDGEWHRVTFERKGNLTQLRVDGRIEGLGTMARDSVTFPRNMPFYIGGLRVSSFYVRLIPSCFVYCARRRLKSVWPPNIFTSKTLRTSVDA